jgi:hypothetical protein
MKDDLAQRLLASVMGWEVERLQHERHALQTLSTYKYDGYENFEPGVKFIESLARWLRQFKLDPADRETAYRLIRDRLVFVSNAEMLHLVRMMYPDVIRPIIRHEVAVQTDTPEYQVSRIEASLGFKRLLRRSLFLGMSDGARMDAFRRSSQDLDNEQVHPVYDVGPEKLGSMHGKLQQALSDAPDEATFRFLFLIDDFAGTGTTILRREDEANAFDGRLKKISDILSRPENRKALDPDGVNVEVCLYMATQKAVKHLRDRIDEFTGAAWASCRVHVIQELNEDLRLNRGESPEFDGFLDRYYSPHLEDKKSYRVGGKGIKYGYGGTGLALVLAHNTPNNSIYVLWKEGSNKHVLVPLFGRFERHRAPVENGDGHQ